MRISVIVYFQYLDIHANIGQCTAGYLIGYWAARISYGIDPISYFHSWAICT